MFVNVREVKQMQCAVGKDKQLFEKIGIKTVCIFGPFICLYSKQLFGEVFRLRKDDVILHQGWFDFACSSKTVQAYLRL